MSAADLYAQLREETRELEAQEEYRHEQQERDRRYALEHSQPGLDGNNNLTTPTKTVDEHGNEVTVISADIHTGSVAPGGDPMVINQDTARYAASRQRKLLTDDDVLQVASNLPFVGENITPFLMGYHDDCLVEFLQGALNRPIESIRIHATSGNRTLMVRCTCPAYQPADSQQAANGAAGSSAAAGNGSNSNKTDWVPMKIILVILKAASLLVPSGSTLTTSVFETMHLACLNHEYKAVRGTTEEAIWRADRMSDQDAEIPLMLGFDSIIHLIIVKNHAASAFKGYRTSTNVLTSTRPAGEQQLEGEVSSAPKLTGFNGVTEVEKDCEFMVQFDAPKDFGSDPAAPGNPWGHMQFQFISLPKFEEQIVSKMHPDDFDKKMKTSSYARWLWFFARQNRINFASEVPAPVMEDALIRSMWFSVATVALTDPILEGWSAEAEKEARAALVKPMVVEHNQRLEKFNSDMQRYAERNAGIVEQ